MAAPSLSILASVVVGSGLGGGARYVIATTAQAFAHDAKGLPQPDSVAFPYGTLLVNLIGCLAIGVLYAVMADRLGGASRTHTYLHAFLVIGVLGGFTTFSSFGLDANLLWRDGQLLRGWSYVIATNVFGVALAVIGHGLAGRAMTWLAG